MNEQCAIDFCCNRIKDFRPSFLKIIEKNIFWDLKICTSLFDVQFICILYAVCVHSVFTHCSDSQEAMNSSEMFEE